MYMMFSSECYNPYYVTVFIHIRQGTLLSQKFVVFQTFPEFLEVPVNFPEMCIFRKRKLPGKVYDVTRTPVV